jgi:hypothetical protein
MAVAAEERLDPVHHVVAQGVMAITSRTYLVKLREIIDSDSEVTHEFS